MTAVIEPTLFVIFGGAGDLARRKLLPSAARLIAAHGWEDRCRVLAVGREDSNDEAYRELARHSLESAGVTQEAIKAWCDESVHYQSVADEAGGYPALAERIRRLEEEHSLPGNRVLYLAIPPRAFEPVINEIGAAGLNRSAGFTRLVIEKPFGSDLDSAQALNDVVHSWFDESQVYRIDHYLGKETVQNLLVFRFANALFESAWNRDRVLSVEITVAESLGIEGRAGYYDHAGAMRDMIQNHVTQVLTLVAMEWPVKLEADAIRDEKVKVLRSIMDIGSEDVVLGQYTGGEVGHETVAGYREEPGVAPGSKTETSVAMRLFVDNWRWQGVPFFIRTGKRMPERLTQIVVRFREPPVCLFEVDGACEVHSDAIVITLQPDEGFQLWFDVKAPTEPLSLQTQALEFQYADAFGELPGAYETLILDFLTGDQTLFVRSDEVEHSWRLFQPILDNPPEPEPYPAGTWGPAGADRLVSTTVRHHWWQDEKGH